MRWCQLFNVVLVMSCIFTFVIPAHSEAKKTEMAKWTLMVYMDGDNNLEKAVIPDIEDELAIQGSSKEVNVVVLADRIDGYSKKAGDWTGTLIFHVTEGMTATPDNSVADWGERNMGDPQTLIDFIVWTKENYPAEHYVLVFWDHGWGWHPDWTMRDDTSGGDALNIDETIWAVTEADKLTGKAGVDVVAYDACQMQWVELATEWQGHAGAIVAAQESVWWEGIDYAGVISELQSNPDMTVEQAGIVIAQCMHNNSERTGSAVSLDEQKWENLIMAVDKWSILLLDRLTTNPEMYLPVYDAAYKKTRYFDVRLYDPNKDLYDAAEEIKIRVADDPVLQDLCQGVMDAVADVVIEEWHMNRYKDAYGLSFFWPQDVDADMGDFWYYQSLKFSELTHWDEFCELYVNLQ